MQSHGWKVEDRVKRSKEVEVVHFLSIVILEEMALILI